MCGDYSGAGFFMILLSFVSVSLVPPRREKKTSRRTNARLWSRVLEMMIIRTPAFALGHRQGREGGTEVGIRYLRRGQKNGGSSLDGLIERVGGCVCLVLFVSVGFLVKPQFLISIFFFFFLAYHDDVMCESPRNQVVLTHLFFSLGGVRRKGGEQMAAFLL